MKKNNVNKIYRAIGLMSGTSLDGVDVAYVETDGYGDVAARGFYYMPYDDALRARIRACFGATTMTDNIAGVERDLTLAHAHAVRNFLVQEKVSSSHVDVVGFHGQTISHDPAHRFTWQLGDGALLASEIGIDVIYDFRTADVSAGGQGAPLIPVYHAALAAASHLDVPVAILNIGGVSNVTWIGEGVNNILAFDCGAGNALIDDVVLKATGEKCDWDGKLAQVGSPHLDVLAQWLSHPYFDKAPPKSLDRGAWDTRTISNFPLQDAVATLTAFTVQSIFKAAAHFPAPVGAWYVSGGGRLNPAVMEGLESALGVPVLSVDVLGWNGDALEAEGFAYLAVRSLLGLPLSFPTTTGVPSPHKGGILVKTPV